MKPETQWNILAAVVVAGFYLCGGGCIGLGMRGKNVDVAQVVVGSGLIVIPSFALSIFLVRYLLGYDPAASAKREQKRQERHLRSMQRELSPPQGGERPLVPASWTPVGELADVRDHLGECEATFKYTPGHGEAIFTAAVFFLVGFVLLVVALATLGRQQSGVVSPLLIVFGLLIMAGSALGLVLTLKSKSDDLRLLIHEKGLVRVDRGRFIVFLWNDILELYQVIVDVYQYGVVHTARDYGFGLYRCDGEVLHIYEGVAPADVGPLSDLLQSKVASVLWPQVIRHFKAGEDVIFGPLTLNRDGLSNGTETIPWSAVEGVTIAEGVVKIRRAGKVFAWSKVELRNIPNLYVFLTLVDKLIGVNR